MIVYDSYGNFIGHSNAMPYKWWTNAAGNPTVEPDPFIDNYYNPENYGNTIKETISYGEVEFYILPYYYLEITTIQDSLRKTDGTPFYSPDTNVKNFIRSWIFEYPYSYIAYIGKNVFDDYYAKGTSIIPHRLNAYNYILGLDGVTDTDAQQEALEYFQILVNNDAQTGYSKGTASKYTFNGIQHTYYHTKYILGDFHYYTDATYTTESFDYSYKTGRPNTVNLGNFLRYHLDDVIRMYNKYYELRNNNVFTARNCEYVTAWIGTFKRPDTKTYTNSTWSTSKTFYIRVTFSKNSSSLINLTSGNVVNYVTVIRNNQYKNVA